MLKKLARMSQIVGSRVDYVQGGGGNTSVKLPGGLMAIKASGFRLSQVAEDDGFAVVETATLKDVTVKQGYKPLRPSVEAGFHALLGTFVLHTHPVYANLALCSADGVEKIEAAMEGYDYLIVPYINPGQELSDYIQTHKRPSTQALFLINHGLVTTADTADACLKIHEDINNRLAAAYGVTTEDFDAFAEEMKKTIYPDQQVYLTLTDVQREIMTAVMFIHMTLMKSGRTAQAMDAGAMNFIANWESEAYRKSILQ